MNRHFYSTQEVEKEVQRPVVKKLFSLCQIRNTNLAFRGEFELKNTVDNVIEIVWKYKKKSLLLRVDLKDYKTER